TGAKYSSSILKAIYWPMLFLPPGIHAVFTLLSSIFLTSNSGLYAEDAESPHIIISCRLFLLPRDPSLNENTSSVIVVLVIVGTGFVFLFRLCFFLCFD